MITDLSTTQYPYSGPDKYTVTKAIAALDGILSFFVPIGQMAMLRNGLTMVGRDRFVKLIVDLAARIESMPKTKDQDGLGKEAIAHLHYTVPGTAIHRFITEKDTGDPDDEVKGAQYQAFGYGSLGYGFEAGYISIQEMLESPATRLNLVFVPMKVGEAIDQVEIRVS